MAGLFGVLTVANRGLLVTQRGIGVTSHNISNVNTPGFSRQRQTLEAVPGILDPNGSPGLGVEQVSVMRISDAFVNQQLVAERSGVGSLETQSAALASVEAIVNEQGGAGLAGAIDGLYNAFSDLASSTTPGQGAEREALRGAARSVVDTLHRYDRELRELQASSDQAIGSHLNQVNALAGRIASLNQAIAGQEATTPSTDLRDQRDVALRELADLVDVQHFEQEDGSLVVLVGNGMPLVQGATTGSLRELADPSNAFNPTYSRIGFDDGTQVVDITDEIGGGRIGGHLAVRDSIVPAAIRAIDTIAFNLSEQTNSVHAAGQGLDGASHEFFAPLVAVEDAARSIAIDADILASTDAIAAGLAADPGDNRNALALADLRTTATPLALPGDVLGAPSGPTRTILDHTSAVVADIGQQTRVVNEARAQQAQTLRVIENRRDEISGVSLDEEMSHLIRLEAAFQANARVVASVDRMLEELVSLL